MVDPFELNEFMDEAFNKGIRCEQDRIIKLLEDNKVTCDCGDTCGFFDAGYDEAIALIKGENK